MKAWMHLRVAAAVIVAGSLAVSSVSAAPLAASQRPAAAASAAQVTPAACIAGHSSACPIRITFATGAYSGQRSSVLTGITAVRWFSVRARANQSMIVIVAGKGSTRGTVYFPNGRRTGQPGGRVFEDVVPVTGTYRIRVTEDSMGEAWHGTVTVLVVIY